MSFTVYRTLAYSWAILLAALVAGSAAWTVFSIMDPPTVAHDDLGDFPSPMFIIIVASLSAFVVAFVAAFFQTKGWTAVVAMLLLAVVLIVVELLDWVLGTWESDIILLAIPAVLGLVVGIVLFLLIVKRSTLGVWVVASLLVAFVVTLWMALELGYPNMYLGVFLFNTMIVVTLVGYKALVTIFTIYKRWTTGA